MDSNSNIPKTQSKSNPIVDPQPQYDSDDFDIDDYDDDWVLIDVITDPNRRNKRHKLIMKDIRALRDIGIRIDYAETIGSGSFGSVFKGQYKYNAFANYDKIGDLNAILTPLRGKQCAMKYFDITTVGEWKMIVLRKEAEAMFSLNHPNIVKLYSFLYLDYNDYHMKSWDAPQKRKHIIESVQTDYTKSKVYPEDDYIDDCQIAMNKGRKSLFIIMEFADLGSLKSYYEFRKSENRFGDNEIKLYVRQLISGLKYIHENGRIHGDVHLGNIVLFQRDVGIVLKYTDFGKSYVPTKRQFEKDFVDDTKDLRDVIKDLFEITEWKFHDNRVTANEILEILDEPTIECWKHIEENQWYNS